MKRVTRRSNIVDKNNKMKDEKIVSYLLYIIFYYTSCMPDWIHYIKNTFN